MIIKELLNMYFRILEDNLNPVQDITLQELKGSAFMWQIKRLLLLDINNCWKK